MQTTPYAWGTYIDRKSPWYIMGRKNLMNRLSRMKNPDLPFPHVATVPAAL